MHGDAETRFKVAQAPPLLPSPPPCRRRDRKTSLGCTRTSHLAIAASLTSVDATAMTAGSSARPGVAPLSHGRRSNDGTPDGPQQPNKAPATGVQAAGMRAVAAQMVAFYFRAPVKAFFRGRIDYMGESAACVPSLNWHARETWTRIDWVPPSRRLCKSDQSAHHRCGPLVVENDYARRAHACDTDRGMGLHTKPGPPAADGQYMVRHMGVTGNSMGINHSQHRRRPLHGLPPQPVLTA